MTSKVISLRRFSRLIKFPTSPFLSSSSSYKSRPSLLEASTTPSTFENCTTTPHHITSRSFCSQPLNLDEARGPAAIDYRSVLQEDEFHRLADSTLHDLQEKLEEYGDNVQVDGLDIDYGNEVLTLKLGELGTYVLNKQTPNRQLWLSSPVSGPFRFDWDRNAQAWVYRQTKANLLKMLEGELEKLCGESIHLSSASHKMLSNYNYFSVYLQAFYNLNYLELHTSFNKNTLHGLACIFRSSPILHTLVLNIINAYKHERRQWNRDLWDMSSSSEEELYWESQIEELKSFLSNLKIVKIHGFVECENEVTLAKFLLKHGKVLEEMNLSTHPNARDSLRRQKIRSQIMGFSWASSNAKIKFHSIN